MSDIETRLFRYFIAVTEEQHFGRAAERLGISPPTLTFQIQKLESQLGARLFERKGNTGVVITDAGQRFLASAREVLRQVEEATAITRQAGRGELGRIQLGFLASMSSSGLLRGWTGAFEQAHPEIHVTMRNLVPTAQIAGIARRELDVGFTRPPLEYPSGVRGFEIYRQALALALPSEHPLARHEAITPAMLADEAFVGITPEIDLGFFGFTEIVARMGNFTPRVVERDNDFTAVLAYVAHGHGIAVAPETVKTMGVANVVFRNIAADRVPHTSIAFVYGSSPSPSARLLIQHMQRYAIRNGGKGAAPPHNHDRVIVPSALNLDPHPEVRAQRASKDAGQGAAACTLRGSRWARAPQGEEMTQQ